MGAEKDHFDENAFVLYVNPICDAPEPMAAFASCENTFELGAVCGAVIEGEQIGKGTEFLEILNLQYGLELVVCPSFNEKDRVTLLAPFALLRGVVPRVAGDDKQEIHVVMRDKQGVPVDNRLGDDLDILSEKVFLLFGRRATELHTLKAPKRQSAKFVMACSSFSCAALYCVSSVRKSFSFVLTKAICSSNGM